MQILLYLDGHQQVVGFAQLVKRIDISTFIWVQLSVVDGKDSENVRAQTICGASRVLVPAMLSSCTLAGFL